MSSLRPFGGKDDKQRVPPSLRGRSAGSQQAHTEAEGQEPSEGDQGTPFIRSEKHGLRLRNPIGGFNL